MGVAYMVSNGGAEATGDPEARASDDYVKAEFIDKGRTGVESGQGFYTYPAID